MTRFFGKHKHVYQRKIMLILRLILIIYSIVSTGPVNRLQNFIINGITCRDHHADHICNLNVFDCIIFSGGYNMLSYFPFNGLGYPSPRKYVLAVLLPVLVGTDSRFHRSGMFNLRRDTRQNISV